MIEPAVRDRDKLDKDFKRLGFILSKLEQTMLNLEGNNLRIVKELQKDADRLQAASNELLEIRSDVERWFPAQRLMRSEMLPHSQQLLSLLALLQTDIGEDLELKQQLYLYRTITSLRWAWLNMISEFRLFVANRFGIFASEYRIGMESRLTNVRYYAEEIPGYLNVLNSMAEQGQIGFDANSSVQQMKQRYEAWMRAFNQFTKILDDPRSIPAFIRAGYEML